MRSGYTFTESIFQLIIMAVFVQFLLFFFIWKGTIEEQYCRLLFKGMGIILSGFTVSISDVSEIQLPFRNQSPD